MIVPVSLRLATFLLGLCCLAPASAWSEQQKAPQSAPHPAGTGGAETAGSTPASVTVQKTETAAPARASKSPGSGDPAAALQAGPEIALPVPNPVRTRNPAVEKAIAAIKDYDLPKHDGANLKEAVRHAFRRRFAEARARERAIKDPVARKLAHWYRLRAGDTQDGAEKIEAFRKANPEWPNQDGLRHTAEAALYKHPGSPERVLAFFEATAPVTGAGKAALARAYLDKGDRAEAARLIKQTWRGEELGESLEASILKRFGELLGPDDHRARIDKLLYADRKVLIRPALRAAKLLGKEETKKVQARAAVISRSRSAAGLLDKLPDEAKKEPGILFARVQWRRRHDKEKEAWELLLEAPADPAQLVDLDEWWVERRINCRNALNKGEYGVAYRLASEHGAVSGAYYGEAEFLAGWIALRFLKRPQKAMTHFIALRTAATDPQEIARAEYWLGRTANALRQMKQADQHLRAAARITQSYYGQIALQTVNAHSARLKVAATPEITEETSNRLMARDAVKAIAVVREAGLDSLTRFFYYQLARSLHQGDEVALVAEIARRLDHVQASVRLAKIALNYGVPVADYAYPVDVFPDYKNLAEPVEPALLHALSRQESEFNERAKSPVGASGLMQLMPRTARAVARSHKVSYHHSKLTAEPSYNLMLGAAHLSDLLETFSGSYIKSLAAYNAGGGRVREWTEKFGDPNAHGIDSIDWVERIPFTETREYVQKIIMTMQVYRARLEGPDGALRIMADINRGKSTKGAEGPSTVTVDASN